MGKLLDGAWLLMQQQRFEQSEPKIREHLREFPDDVSGQVCLGLCLCDLGRYPEGIAAAHAALALEPDNAYAHWLLGAINLRTQQLDQAEADFLKTIALDPEQPSFYASLGELYWQRGRQQKAGTDARTASLQCGIAAVETGLAINPEHQNCQEYLVRNLLATAAADLLSEAIGVAEAFLASAPENAAAYEVYAQALLLELQNQGRRITRSDVARILPILQESLRLDPQNPAPQVYGHSLLTNYYRRWSSRWSMLFGLAVWPLCVLTACLYQSARWHGYPIGICLGLCAIGLVYLGDATYADWKIKRHPHHRQFADPQKSGKGLKFLWGLIAATVVVGLVWSWLPGWVIGGILLMFWSGLGLLGLVVLLQLRRLVFWWTKDPDDYDNVLRCLWGLGVVGVLIGLTSTPGWLTGVLLLLFRIGLFLLGIFLLLMARPCFFGVKQDKPE
jgi:tetratricopeptide (TPR) repeat protein